MHKVCNDLCTQYGIYFLSLVKTCIPIISKTKIYYDMCVLPNSSASCVEQLYILSVSPTVC